MASSLSDKIYITTPIYYVNAQPHLGHAYTTMIADVLKKHSVQRGARSIFLTGTDEHGEKISQKAAEAGMPEQAFVDRVAGEFQAAWRALELEPDIFYRTTAPSHKKLVQTVLSRLKDEELIYFAEYEGNYCVGCERFLTDQELDAEGKCPDHRTVPAKRKEGNYFFRMGQFQERVLEYYRAQPEAILPSRYMNEVLSMLSGPLGDLSISRPKSRVSWGIPLPFDDAHVTYVWFDALLNYLGGLGYDGTKEGGADFDEDMWRHSVHLIGKDILKTHAVYWPTMLIAMGLDPFRRLQVGGFWISEGAKMSKSLGNVVDPVGLAQVYGTEPLRYYLLSEAPYGEDANFVMQNFVNKCNADLANGIGNLASRSLTLIKKNFDGKMPVFEDASVPPAVAAASKSLLAEVHALPATFAEAFDAAKYQQALRAFSETVARCDRYVNDTAPWSLAKAPEKRAELSVVLATLANALSTLATVVYALTPKASLALRTALGFAEDGAVPEWSRAGDLIKAGTPFGEVPRLFPRFEMPAKQEG
ncbi:MAG TPA: class I tRNA ligase family protein [Bdellovibrionota bacterium]|jgi:methionyl-tRNA synthetase|nr:class I tRNA ligase family protein [Bdellovibrionota bacterium]